MALFGAMWGVGNVSYGLTMRYLGMSLGIGVAIGVTLVVGTLIPPLLNGQAGVLFETRSGLLTMAGVVVALIGVAIVSYAGHLKEMQLKSGSPTEFNVMLGLALAVMCGIFSSGMSFAMDAAKPMQAARCRLGVNPSVFGAAELCVHHGRRRAGEFRLLLWTAGDGEEDFAAQTICGNRRSDGRNAALAATGGIMWYLQFFFYAWGAANIPERLSYVNWMLHMSGYVLFGGIVGLALGEWAGVSKPVGSAAVGGNRGDYCGGEPGGAGVVKKCSSREFTVEAKCRSVAFRHSRVEFEIG